MERPPEEKKRRSSSRPRGEVEPKRCRSSGAEPSWDISQVGSQQPDKAQSQPPSEPKPSTPPPKLKSAVKSVRLNLPKPEDLEGLGPAARSRYDDSAKDDRPQRDKSDTVLMPTIDRAPKAPVVPTGDPEGMTGGPTRALQSTIPKKAWALN